MEYKISKDDIQELSKSIFLMSAKDLIISTSLWDEFSPKEQTNLTCSFKKILFMDCSYTNDPYKAYVVGTEYKPTELYKWDKHGRRKVVK